MKVEKTHEGVRITLRNGPGHYIFDSEAICLRDQLNTLLPMDTIDIASAWRSKAARMEQELVALKAENDRLRLMVLQGAVMGAGGGGGKGVSSPGFTVTSGAITASGSGGGKPKNTSAEPPASITKEALFKTWGEASGIDKDANAAMITRDAIAEWDKLDWSAMPKSKESHINALHGNLERDAALCRGIGANVRKMGGF